MKLTCWYYDVSELYDPEMFEKGMRLLPWQERREKVMRYRFRRDRCLCLGAGLLAASVLTWYSPLLMSGEMALCGEDAGLRGFRLDDYPAAPGVPHIAYTERGKPFPAGEPALHFNISHSGSMAVCAAADKAVGVDVEKHMEYDSGIAGLAFADDEREWLKAQDDVDRGFTRIWTRKESYLKMTGEGITDDLKGLSVRPGARTDNSSMFREFDLRDYHIALCVDALAEFPI